VINGASDLFVEVLGDAGRHVRSAVGMQQLHYGMAIEIEGLFEVAEAPATSTAPDSTSRADHRSSRPDQTQAGRENVGM
jgi:hypothetical protein